MVGVSKGGPSIEDETENIDLDSEKLPPDGAAKETSSAYAKQADSSPPDNETSPKLDKEL